jgi:hypothetical protein
MFKGKLSESESRRLPESASQGVAMVSRGVAIKMFQKLASTLRTLNGQTSPFKDQFGKKEARDVMYYHHLFI